MAFLRRGGRTGRRVCCPYWSRDVARTGSQAILAWQVQLPRIVWP